MVNHRDKRFNIIMQQRKDVITMNRSKWFQKQLQTTAETLIWTAAQVPQERQYRDPPSSYFGTWPAARHVFHLCYSEQTLVVPSMRQWLGAKKPSLDPFQQETTVWNQGTKIEDILNQIQQIRDEQIALIKQYKDDMWEESRDTIWDSVSLYWVVSKTLQHTFAHMNRVLQFALFWDRK